MFADQSVFVNDLSFYPEVILADLYSQDEIMQLSAHDEKKNIIFAHRAERHQNYYCLECQGIVRLRGGIHRRNHFYHLRPPQQCRQNGKSMEHLQVQWFLLEQLGGDCMLEAPFPSIGRIADCVWPSEKIIFEVQCSPISKQEVLQRNADYGSLGYRVVWVLHDRQFNQRRLSAAELWLTDQPHYFTNINADGEGCIYDQIDRKEGGIRRTILKAVPITPKKPYFEVKYPLPPDLDIRARAWKIGFQGDWISLAGSLCHIQLINESLVESELSSPSWRRRIWETCIARPYRVVFAYFLEKSCH